MPAEHLAATGLDFPFRETFDELIALAQHWEREAEIAQDAMERVVLNGCARALREVIDVQA